MTKLMLATMKIRGNISWQKFFGSTKGSKKDSSSTCSSPSAASEAISLINNQRRQFREGLVAREIDVIINFILMGEMEYRSIEELCFYLEQLFVDMLPFFLSQLPLAILKEVNDSPNEVHEEKARFVLKLLFKLKLLEDKVQWSFPEGHRITRLMDPEGEDINDEAGNTGNLNAAPVVEDQDGEAPTIHEVPDVEMGSQG
ncbi:hypothetical protein Sjap_009162 [Stephania japonica]|uniref:Uncharacterized protein n=1 Tax=Stephania japonica TaxID=461633 RepID=A0AAP0JQV5_9MAGN